MYFLKKKLFLFTYLFGCAGSQLKHSESLVVACELLVWACGFCFPDQESSLGPLHWDHGIPAPGPGQSLYIF